MKEKQFKKYLQSLQLSKSTVSNYLYQIKKFEEVNKVNIDIILKNNDILYGENRNESYVYALSRNNKEHGDFQASIKKYENMLNEENFIIVNKDKKRILLSEYGKVVGYFVGNEIYLLLNSINRIFNIKISENALINFEEVQIVLASIDGKEDTELISSNCIEVIKKYMNLTNKNLILLDMLKNEIDLLKILKDSYEYDIESYRI